jgi:DMSO/TMAO reductase YedYZ molybdopterin-dependent catalytic subunit
VPTRRAFLAAAASAAACGRERPIDVGDTRCGADLARGTFLGLRPLLDGSGRELEVPYGSGLEARQIVDLELLDPEALVMSAERFYLRTGAPPDLGDLDAWEIRLTGRVSADRALGIDELLARVEDMGRLHLECSGNADGARFGLMSAGEFAGVPMSWVLAQAAPEADATAIRITGRDTHPASSASILGAAWVFRPDELDEAWLVTHQDGAPIPEDHGRPVRLLVPGWYGCTCIKWVEEIAWVGDDEPATTQMKEFAGRTHQDGAPDLARDYAPAESEAAATPVRVETWRIDGERVLRVIGAVWGGRRQPDALRLLMDGEDLGPVELCEREHARTWGLWEAFLPAGASGVVTLRLEADGVPARRLDSRYYARPVDLG